MKLISTDEAAMTLGVSGRRVRQLIGAGTLPAQKIGGGYVIDESVLKTVCTHGKPGRPPIVRREIEAATNAIKKRAAKKGEKK